jgi:hypothetical protein
MDADEALSPELKESILHVKLYGRYNGYRMNRLTNYCGTWIRHGGWYPDTKLRLFNKHMGRWKGDHIHEEIVFDSNIPVGKLDGDLYHYSYYNLTDHIRQANHFTDLNARELFIRGQKAGLFRILLSPCTRFIRDYILRLGFIDGYYGWVIARISAHAVFLKYTKLRFLLKSEGKHANKRLTDA